VVESEAGGEGEGEGEGEEGEVDGSAVDDGACEVDGAAESEESESVTAELSLAAAEAREAGPVRPVVAWSSVAMTEVYR